MTECDTETPIEHVLSAEDTVSNPDSNFKLGLFMQLFDFFIVACIPSGIEVNFLQYAKLTEENTLSAFNAVESSKAKPMVIVGMLHLPVQL